MGEVAKAVYHNSPTKPLLIGVTGTNGKTTTTYLFQALFKALGVKSGLSGTVERRVGDEGVETRESGRLTTPEADYLHEVAQRLAGRPYYIKRVW